MNIKKELYEYERIRGKSKVFLFYALICALFCAVTSMVAILVAFNFNHFLAGTMEEVPHAMEWTMLSMPLTIPFFIYFKRKVYENKWIGIIMGTVITLYLSGLITLGTMTAASPDIFIGLPFGLTFAGVFAYMSYVYHRNALKEMELW